MFFRHIQIDLFNFRTLRKQINHFDAQQSINFIECVEFSDVKPILALAEINGKTPNEFNDLVGYDRVDRIRYSRNNQKNKRKIIQKKKEKMLK